MDANTARFLNETRLQHRSGGTLSDAMTDVHMRWADDVSGRGSIAERAVHDIAHDAYLRVGDALSVDVEDAEDTYTADDIDRHLAHLTADQP